MGRNVRKDHMTFIGVKVRKKAVRHIQRNSGTVTPHYSTSWASQLVPFKGTVSRDFRHFLIQKTPPGPYINNEQVLYYGGWVEMYGKT